MPVALIGSAATAGEFAYDAYNAGSDITAAPQAAPVALTPQENAFYEKEAINAQNASAAQTQAYETSATNQQAQSDLLKWGVGISVCWLLWRMATKRKLI